MKLLESGTRTMAGEQGLPFDGIVHTLFQRPSRGRGVAIGFTSANPGEGVTYVSRSIASQLAADRSESVTYLSSAQLREETGPEEMDEEGEVPAKNSWDDWESKISHLRSRYRYSILDCASVTKGSDVLNLAPHLDGIVIVVAANETRKAQMANVQRQIEMVHGKILGTILNKRQYLIPRWLHKLL